MPLESFAPQVKRALEGPSLRLCEGASLRRGTRPVNRMRLRLGALLTTMPLSFSILVSFSQGRMFRRGGAFFGVSHFKFSATNFVNPRWKDGGSHRKYSEAFCAKGLEASHFRLWYPSLISLLSSAAFYCFLVIVFEKEMNSLLGKLVKEKS